MTLSRVVPIDRFGMSCTQHYFDVSIVAYLKSVTPSKRVKAFAQAKPLKSPSKSVSRAHVKRTLFLESQWKDDLQFGDWYRKNLPVLHWGPQLTSTQTPALSFKFSQKFCILSTKHPRIGGPSHGCCLRLDVATAAKRWKAVAYRVYLRAFACPPSGDGG